MKGRGQVGEDGVDGAGQVIAYQRESEPPARAGDEFGLPVDDGDAGLKGAGNLDGLPPFKSSNRSLWPIQCTVKGLHPDDRKRNVLLSGLWFGQTKPVMSAFLVPLVEDAELQANGGIEGKNPTTEASVSSRVHFVCASCDAVARPIIRNCTV